MTKLMKYTTSITLLFLVLFFSGCTETFLVDFDTDGAIRIESVEVTEGNSITEPVIPEKEGYDFIGWYSDSTFNVIFDFAQPIVGTITLYAKFEVNQYTIAFEANNGFELQDITQEFDTDFIIPIIEKEGYQFLGWFEDEELTMEFDNYIVPSKDSILHAKWEINQYTITFESNNGIELPDITQVFNSTLDIPDVEKDKYKFLGWYEDEEFTIEFDTYIVPSKDLILYAKWELDQISLTLIGIDGEILDSLDYDYNTNLSVIPLYSYPLIEGLIFEGWYFDTEFLDPVEINSYLLSDLNIYANYDEIFTIEELVTNQELYVGTTVIIHGIITSTINGHPYIEQDGFGIYLYIGYVFTTKLAIGNEVKIESLTIAYYPDAETGVLQLIGFDRANIEVLSEGNEVIPTTKEVANLTIMDLGSFVKIEGLTVVSIYTSTNTGDHTISCEDSLGNSIDIHVRDSVTRTEINSMFVIGEQVDVIAPLGRYMSVYQLELSTLDGVSKVE